MALSSASQRPQSFRPGRLPGATCVLGRPWSARRSSHALWLATSWRWSLCIAPCLRLTRPVPLPLTESRRPAGGKQYP